MPLCEGSIGAAVTPQPLPAAFAVMAFVGLCCLFCLNCPSLSSRNAQVPSQSSTPLYACLHCSFTSLFALNSFIQQIFMDPFVCPSHMVPGEEQSVNTWPNPCLPELVFCWEIWILNKNTTQLNVSHGWTPAWQRGFVPAQGVDCRGHYVLLRTFSLLALLFHCQCQPSFPSPSDFRQSFFSVHMCLSVCLSFPSLPH